MYKYLLSLLLFHSISVTIYSQEMGQMSMDAKYKSIYNSVLNALTSGNVDGLEKYVTSDFIEHDPNPGMTEKTGIEGLKEVFVGYNKIFPDMKAEVHNMAVDGEYLFVYLTFTGTSSEPYMGMPAGHKMTMNSVDLIRFKGDKAAEHWGFTANSDIMNMMPQDKMMHEGMHKK